MAKPAKPLKIGLVVDDGLDKPDGVQQYVLGVGEWLRGQGHDVQYLAGQTSRQDLQGVHSLSRNMKVRFNGNSLSMPLPTSRSKIRRFVRSQHFDVLHVQTPHSPFMGQHVIMSAENRTAVIGTFHILPYGWLSSYGNRLLGIWLRPSLKRFDEVVSVSPAAAEFAQSSFGIRTSVLPNVINVKPFLAAKPLPNPDGKLTILYLGRLVPRKGCMLLMEAVKLLADKKNLPRFRVLVCGGGPEEAKLRNFIRENGLDSTVTLEGFVSEADKLRYYASADIAVFPSLGGESFGIVLLEAMAAGKPVVLAGDNPGYRSVLGERPELLFDTKDANALADKLEHYLTHEEERLRLQEWSRHHVMQFDVSTVGTKLLGIYDRALRKRREA